MSTEESTLEPEQKASIKEMLTLHLQIERHNVQRPKDLDDEKFRKMQEEEKLRNESDRQWAAHMKQRRIEIENLNNPQYDGASDFMTDVDGPDKRLPDYKTDYEGESVQPSNTKYDPNSSGQAGPDDYGNTDGFESDTQGGGGDFG